MGGESPPFLTLKKKGSTMWIFMNDSMLSIVAHKDKPEHLLVRSRIEGDIESEREKERISRQLH